VVLSVEELVFIVEYVFREGNRYTDLVQEQQNLRCIVIAHARLMSYPFGAGIFF
jgi:hypothetical protein